MVLRTRGLGGDVVDRGDGVSPGRVTLREGGSGTRTGVSWGRTRGRGDESRVREGGTRRVSRGVSRFVMNSDLSGQPSGPHSPRRGVDAVIVSVVDGVPSRVPGGRPR